MLTVSAVIPTCNGTRYLADAVRSALAQTSGLLEIIVIDDGSRVDIRQILSPFHPRVTYVRQDNAGPAAARNHGVLRAKGDLIAFLDDDDLWHPRKTAEQARLLEAHPDCALVYSWPEFIDEEGQVLPFRPPPEFPSGRAYPDFLVRNRISTPSATLIRREAFEAVGGFDENREFLCGEDYDLWLRLARDYEVRFCPGRLVSYRVRAAGISQNPDKAFKGDLYLFRKLVARHHREPRIPDAEFYTALDYNLCHTFRRFAYRYYYVGGDRRTARDLLLATYNRQAWWERTGGEPAPGFRQSTFRRYVYYAGLEAAAAEHRTLRTLVRICPHYVRDLLFLAIFSLPEAVFRAIRNVKRRLCAALHGSIEKTRLLTRSSGATEKP
jgi:glycosyltransferase involved in cell wall biosynthesis